MKKTGSLILSILLLLCSTLSGCAAEEAAQPDNHTEIVLQIGNPMMTVNKIEKEIDPGRGTVPIIMNNRTLVPVRAIIEEMGGNAAWEGDTQTASFTIGSNVIRLTVDSTTAYLNDEVHTLDVAPTIVYDRTMLPIRFIAESFQFSVNWNEGEQTVTIIGNVQSGEPSGPAAPIPEESATSNSSRVAVVYFSATGNTKALAEKIGVAANADLYEIIPKIPYTSEDLNYNTDNCRANQELESDARPEIEAFDRNMESYDVIFLGYPIWWGQCPPAVRTFLDTYDLSGKTIIPFCTSGSSGISSSLSKIHELCPDSTITNGFRGTGSATEEQIEQWFVENNFTVVKDDTSESTQTNTLYIKVNDTVFTATLVDNSSTAALKELLAQGPLTINMHDYGNFEKVGPIGKDLPRNDEQITTEPGDLILYQGNSFVIYYGTNSWNFTRLGKINNATQEQLKTALGSGDVTVTLSI